MFPPDFLSRMSALKSVRAVAIRTAAITATYKFLSAVSFVYGRKYRKFQSSNNNGDKDDIMASCSFIWLA